MQVEAFKEAFLPGSGMQGENPFEQLAEKYDQWFETPRGRAIFSVETACLRELMNGAGKAWLEVGVGSGRFAQALDVQEGVDPSPSMLEMAGSRGILVRKGAGEELPYPDDVFDGVLMVTTLCFLFDPEKVFVECTRVLKNNGCLVLGMIPAESKWAELYEQKGIEGHPVYSRARFYTSEKALYMASAAGFYFERAASCLFTAPDQPLAGSMRISPRAAKGAGFAGMKFIYVPVAE